MHISLYALEDCVVALGELLNIHIIKYQNEQNNYYGLLYVPNSCVLLLYYHIVTNFNKIVPLRHW